MAVVVEVAGRAVHLMCGGVALYLLCWEAVQVEEGAKEVFTFLQGEKMGEEGSQQGTA